MPPTTEQAVIMLSSHFYESRDGSTGGFLRTTPERHNRCGTRSICCCGLDRDWCDHEFRGK